MADNNSELLALMGDLIRATDRQTEENKRAIQEMGAKFEHIFSQFATATADGFIRVEKKIDDLKQEIAGVKQEVAGVKQEVAGVKQEVADLRQDVQRIDQRLERVEKALPGYEDIVRRLIILENIVLPKAS